MLLPLDTVLPFSVTFQLRDLALDALTKASWKIVNAIDTEFRFLLLLSLFFFLLPFLFLSLFLPSRSWILCEDVLLASLLCDGYRDFEKDILNREIENNAGFPVHARLTRPNKFCSRVKSAILPVTSVLCSF